MSVKKNIFAAVKFDRYGGLLFAVGIMAIGCFHVPPDNSPHHALTRGRPEPEGCWFRTVANTTLGQQGSLPNNVTFTSEIGSPFSFGCVFLSLDNGPFLAPVYSPRSDSPISFATGDFTPGEHTLLLLIGLDNHIAPPGPGITIFSGMHRWFYRFIVKPGERVTINILSYQAGEEKVPDMNLRVRYRQSIDTFQLLFLRTRRNPGLTAKA